MNTVQLPHKWINILVTLPETGMGYQLVTVILKNGNILRNHKVVNGSILILEKNEQLSKEDIALIKSENSWTFAVPFSPCLSKIFAFAVPCGHG